MAKVVAFIFSAAVIFLTVFYWRNIKGLLPALLPATSEDLPLSLPPGFSISIFAKDLVNPRVMIYDSGGTMLVSIPSEGKVVALPDRDEDGKADETIVVLKNLNRPHGLSMRCTEQCQLYVAETDKVVVYDYHYDESRKIYQAVNGRKIIDLPSGGGHFTRSILFMPPPNDHKLLIAVGSSCNVCEESDWRRAKILIANAGGSDLKEYARGLRNSVFMNIHPITGEIWATEMGRDFLGDNLPPDEINIIREGRNYGWPICYGKNIHDTDYDKNVYIRNPCMEPFETPSYIDIPAHSAPLGLAFFPQEGWPQEYWDDLLVAYHGSWNRTEPTGYKIVRFKLNAEGKYLGEEDFITGWLQDGNALGRPVDILVQPGGLIYISDDKAGVIYRVAYRQQKSDLILAHYPQPNEIIKSPLVVTGQARGQWFFEASFPVRLLDGNGREISVGIAQAQTEWRTTNFVPFRAELKFSEPETDSGELIFEKSNPSGLPEHTQELRIPVKFR